MTTRRVRWAIPLLGLLLCAVGVVSQDPTACPAAEGADACMDRRVGLLDAVPSYCRAGQEPPNHEPFIQAMFFSQCRGEGGAFEECRFVLDGQRVPVSFMAPTGGPVHLLEVANGMGRLQAAATHAASGSGFELEVVMEGGQLGGGGADILRLLKGQCYADHPNAFSSAVDVQRQCHFGAISGTMTGYGACQGAQATITGYPMSNPKRPSIGCGSDQKSHLRQGVSSWFLVTPSGEAASWPATCVIPFFNRAGTVGIQGDLSMALGEEVPVASVGPSPSPSPSMEGPPMCDRTCPTCPPPSTDLEMVPEGAWMIEYLSRDFDGTHSTFRWRITATSLPVQEWVLGLCRHVNLEPFPFVASAALGCDAYTGLFGLTWESWLNEGEGRDFTLRLPGDIPVVEVPYTIRLRNQYRMGVIQGPRPLCEDELPPSACTCTSWRSVQPHISEGWCNQNCCPYGVLHVACDPTVGPPHRACRCNSFGPQ